MNKTSLATMDTTIPIHKQLYLRQTELTLPQMSREQLEEFTLYLLKSYLAQEALYQSLLMDNVSFVPL